MRILSLVLAVCLVLGTAFCASADWIPGSDVGVAEEAVPAAVVLSD